MEAIDRKEGRREGNGKRRKNWQRKEEEVKDVEGRMTKRKRRTREKFWKLFGGRVRGRGGGRE